jgi:hypothetical protein
MGGNFEKKRARVDWFIHMGVGTKLHSYQSESREKPAATRFVDKI